VFQTFRPSVRGNRWSSLRITSGRKKLFQAPLGNGDGQERNRNSDGKGKTRRLAPKANCAAYMKQEGEISERNNHNLRGWPIRFARCPRAGKQAINNH